MTVPDDLLVKWKSFDKEKKVIAFYSDKSDYYPCFSNFFRHKPFNFIIPKWCGKFAGTSVPVEFSEKAIMLCKASLFSDEIKFHEIRLANTPMKAKQLGRKCKFNPNIWNKFVCKIAEEVVYQKFLLVDGLKQILVNTGDVLIAEAAPRDKIWGIGMSRTNPLVNIPSKWKGINILGWALMLTRSKLK